MHTASVIPLVTAHHTVLFSTFAQYKRLNHTADEIVMTKFSDAHGTQTGGAIGQKPSISAKCCEQVTKPLLCIDNKLSLDSKLPHSDDAFENFQL